MFDGTSLVSFVHDENQNGINLNDDFNKNKKSVTIEAFGVEPKTYLKLYLYFQCSYLLT